MDPLIQYLTVGALAAVTWFGVPGAGDAALVAAAIWAAQGQLSIEAVLISAFIGALIGGGIGYRLGWDGGRPLLERPGRFLSFRLKALAKGDRVIARFGRIASVMVLPIVCGVNAMPARTFWPYSTLGRLGWVLSTGLVAFYFGEAAVKALKRIGLPVILAILVIAAIYLGIRYAWSQRHPAADPGSGAGAA
jgi:undecaprenyl-diphosphatase